VRFLLPILLVAGLASSSTVSAQSSTAFDIFSGVISLVETKAAQKSWEKLDGATFACMRSSLSEQDVTIEALVRSGVSPSDIRLRELREQCSRAVREAEDGTSTSKIIDQIEQALSDSDAHGALRQQDEEELVALRQEASELANRGDASSRRASNAVVLQIDDALAGRSNAPSVATIRARLAQISDAVQGWQTWDELASEATGLADQADRGEDGDLPAGFARRRAELRHALKVALHPPAAVQRQYTLPPADCVDETNPIGMLICRDEDARWIVLEQSRAYYLMRHLRPSEREKLAAASVSFQRKLVDRCGVRAALSNAPKQSKAILCVTAGFAEETRKMRSAIERIATSDATEEIARPIDDHLQLQGELREQGYLPPDGDVDGVYGPQTRAALEQLAYAAGFPARGVMSNRAAEALKARQSARDAPDTTAIAALQRIIDDYRRYDRDLSDARRIAQEQEELRAQHAERVAVARQLLGGQLSESLRSFLLTYVQAAGRASPTSQELTRLDSEFGDRSAELERARQINALLTEKNRMLLDSEGGFVILYNDSASAPSVSRGLAGNLVFTGDDIRVCAILTEPPDRFVSGQLRQAFAGIGANVRLPLDACDTNALERYDLVLAAGGESAFAPLLALLQSIKDGVMQQASVVSRPQIDAARSARNTRQAEVKGFAESAAAGFGYLSLENESTDVCAVVPAGLDEHATLIAEDAELVQDELGRPGTYVERSTEEAFVEAKRHKCGAIYAVGSDLAALSEAFDRDEVEYSFWPLWHDQDQVHSSAATASLRKKREAEEQADKARELTDAEILTQAKEAEVEVVRRKQQSALRQQYGAAAKAFELRLSEELRLFLQGDVRAQRFSSKYGTPATTYQSLAAEGWELIDQSTELIDYGTADFKGRRLELGIARSVIKLRNRLLGEYRDLCFVTAFVDDAEFAMDREPFGVPCGDSAEAIQTYKLGQRFESRWVVD
jgi:peptidoglycan hydrolase-like protein with peptidoglycan-binding domain